MYRLEITAYTKDYRDLGIHTRFEGSQAEAEAKRERLEANPRVISVIIHAPEATV